MSFRRYLRVSVALILISLAISCLDPYEIPDTYSGKAYLVVDGFINAGNKTAEVKLSKSVPLNEPTNGTPMIFCDVSVEGANGKMFQLNESTPGVYSAANLDISNGEVYKLRIRTGEGEYLSDDVELKKAPLLDSITWKGTLDGVTIYINAHDVSGSTDFYLWTFKEVWEHNTELFSAYSFDSKSATVTQRRPGSYVNLCYNSAISTRVLINSTTANSLDVVSEFPLTFIKRGSRKVSRLYSITVQQRALDEQAYNYWRNLQRSTENLGGLFDPLPSEVTGNVHSVNNATERVLGYFSGGEIQEERLFINFDDLPPVLQYVERMSCPLDTIRNQNLALYKNYPLYLVDSYGTPTTLGYTSSAGICLDCRLSGGVLEKPAFWPR
jgi:Domain of unknown function (DUF4249)